MHRRNSSVYSHEAAVLRSSGKTQNCPDCFKSLYQVFNSSHCPRNMASFTDHIVNQIEDKYEENSISLVEAIHELTEVIRRNKDEYRVCICACEAIIGLLHEDFDGELQRVPLPSLNEPADFSTLMSEPEYVHKSRQKTSFLRQTSSVTVNCIRSLSFNTENTAPLVPKFLYYTLATMNALLERTFLDSDIKIEFVDALVTLLAQNKTMDADCYGMVIDNLEYFVLRTEYNELLATKKIISLLIDKLVGYLEIGAQGLQGKEFWQKKVIKVIPRILLTLANLLNNFSQHLEMIRGDIWKAMEKAALICTDFPEVLNACVCLMRNLTASFSAATKADILNMNIMEQVLSQEILGEDALGLLHNLSARAPDVCVVLGDGSALPLICHSIRTAIDLETAALSARANGVSEKVASASLDGDTSLAVIRFGSLALCNISIGSFVKNRPFSLKMIEVVWSTIIDSLEYVVQPIIKDDEIKNEDTVCHAVEMTEACFSALNEFTRTHTTALHRNHEASVLKSAILIGSICIELNRPAVSATKYFMNEATSETCRRHIMNIVFNGVESMARIVEHACAHDKACERSLMPSLESIISQMVLEYNESWYESILKGVKEENLVLVRAEVEDIKNSVDHLDQVNRTFLRDRALTVSTTRVVVDVENRGEHEEEVVDEDGDGGEEDIKNEESDPCIIA